MTGAHARGTAPSQPTGFRVTLATLPATQDSAKGVGTGDKKPPPNGCFGGGLITVTRSRSRPLEGHHADFGNSQTSGAFSSSAISRSRWAVISCGRRSPNWSNNSAWVSTSPSALAFSTLMMRL